MEIQALPCGLTGLELKASSREEKLINLLTAIATRFKVSAASLPISSSAKPQAFNPHVSHMSLGKPEGPQKRKGGRTRVVPTRLRIPPPPPSSGSRCQ